MEGDCHRGFLRCCHRRRGQEHGGAAAGIGALIDRPRFHASQVDGWHRWRLRSAHFSSYAVRFVHASYLSVLRAPQHGCRRSARARTHGELEEGEARLGAQDCAEAQPQAWQQRRRRAAPTSLITAPVVGGKLVCVGLRG